MIGYYEEYNGSGSIVHSSPLFIPLLMALHIAVWRAICEGLKLAEWGCAQYECHSVVSLEFPQGCKDRFEKVGWQELCLVQYDDTVNDVV